MCRQAEEGMQEEKAQQTVGQGRQREGMKGFSQRVIRQATRHRQTVLPSVPKMQKEKVPKIKRETKCAKMSKNKLLYI